MPYVPDPVTLDPADPVGLVRLLIPDTDQLALLFTDDQIGAFLALNAANPRRAAAEALETLASNEALVSKVIKTQDLATDGTKVAAELRARATSLREQADRSEELDDPAGGFTIVDWHPDYDRRYWAGPWPGELAERPWC